jgi:hypothetical protein
MQVMPNVQAAGARHDLSEQRRRQADILSSSVTRPPSVRTVHAFDTFPKGRVHSQAVQDVLFDDLQRDEEGADEGASGGWTTTHDPATISTTSGADDDAHCLASILAAVGDRRRVSGRIETIIGLFSTVCQ